KDVSGTRDCNRNRMNVDSLHVAQDEPEPGFRCTIGVVRQEVIDCGTQEAARPTAWVKHRLIAMLRKKFLDDSFAKPVRGVILAKVVAVFRVNQLLINP